jgi:hypothetical protein
MPTRLHRYYGAGYLHFITTSCYQRRALLGPSQNRDFFRKIFKGEGRGGTPERMKITRLSPALSAQTQDYYQQKSTALDLRVATAGRTRARGFQSEIGSQRFVALRCRELCSLYRGNLKFTVICVWISTGDPSSR